jgi:hypothetical protein
MKRTMMLSFAALAAMTLLAAPILAKAPVRHAASASITPGQTCDPSHCSGHCPSHPGAKAAGAPVATAKAGSESCPISDPSQCPADCPFREGSADATPGTIL